MGNRRHLFLVLTLSVVAVSLPCRCRVNLYKLRKTLRNTSLFLFRNGKIRTHQRHRHSVVVTDFVEPDGFETVGFFKTETVGTGGTEGYAEAFTGEGNCRIEIYAIDKINCNLRFEI